MSDLDGFNDALDRILHEAEAGIALRRNSVPDSVANGNIANQ